MKEAIRRGWLGAILAAAFCVLMVCGQAAAAQDASFIWVGNASSQFTESELQAIVDNYSTVFLTKFHARWRLDWQDADAAELKRRNPSIKIYPYFASSLWFTSYRFADLMTEHPEWLLKRPDGTPIPYNDTGLAYYMDLSNEDLRAWIVELIRGWMAKKDGDGNNLYDGIALDVTNIYDVYTDKGLANSVIQSLVAQLGDGALEKLEEWNEGARQLIKEVKALGVSVVFNGIENQPWRYKRSLELLDEPDDADGAMDEGFCADSGNVLKEVALLANIDLMMDPAYTDKTFFEKANVTLKDGMTVGERPRYQRLCYGSFLLGYRPGHAYFKYVEDNAYTTTGEIGDGTMDPVELDLNLGAPQSAYVHQADSSIYSRQYANGWVFVNLGTKDGVAVLPEESLVLYENGAPKDAFYPGSLLALQSRDSAFLLKADANTLIARFSPYLGVAGLSVAFTDQSSGTVVSRTWDFGDGTTSTEANPRHEYVEPGVYTVTLQVAGTSRSDTETRTVVVNPRLSDVTMDEDASGTLIEVPLAAASTEWGTIQLSVASSDEDLLPLERINVGGSGTNRWIRIAHPGTDRNGSAVLTVTASDGAGSWASQSFTVNVTPVNDAPVALDTSVSTPEDKPCENKTLMARDVDGDALTFEIVTQPAHGAVVLLDSAAGTFTYTPEANFWGTDSFTFRVSDGVLESVPATVTVTVRPVNDAPAVPSELHFSTLEDTPVSGTLEGSDVDGDAIVFNIISTAAHGTLVVDSSTGAFTYAPNADYSGSDGFRYRVSDGSDLSDPVLVTIEVQAVADAPIVENVVVTTDEDTRVAVTLVGSDPDSGETRNLVYTVLTQPAHGKLSGTGRNLFFMPESNYSGDDGFTYQASDGELTSNIGQVTIHITPVDDGPAIGAISSLDKIVAGSVVGPIPFTVSDIDTPASALVVTAQSDNAEIAPAQVPNIVLGGTDSERWVTVTTNPGVVGTVRITLTVSDGEYSAGTSFTIRVVNQAPVANAGPDQEVFAGDVVTLNGQGSTDLEDGTPKTYLWTQMGTAYSVALAGADTPTATFTAPKVNRTGATLTFRLQVWDKEGLRGVDSCTVKVKWSNTPPVANAGPDQSVKEGNTVVLDGRGSTDAEGGLLSTGTFAWRQIPTATVTLKSPTSARTTFVTPDVGRDGEAFIFELTVTDKDGGSSTARCCVVVEWVNAPPVARAVAPSSKLMGQTVTLDGSQSYDPDQNIVSYHWVQKDGPSVVLSDASAVQPSFVAPGVSRDGATLTFELTVTDEKGLSSTATCSVKVRWQNTGPKADAGGPYTVNEGERITLDGTHSTDPDDGTPSKYLWTQTSTAAITLEGADTATPSFIAPDVTQDTILTFRLKVEDLEGVAANATTQVTVLRVITAPVANAGDDRSVPEGETVELDGSASNDPDGTITAYEWRQTSGTTVELDTPNAAKARFKAPDVGLEGETLVFELTVTDNDGATNTDECTITVSWVECPATVDAGPDQKVHGGTVVTLNGANSRDEDGIATVNWVQLDGPEVEITNATEAVATFLAPETMAGPASLSFQLTVEDVYGTRTTDTCIVNVTDGNAPPHADAGPERIVSEGETVVLDGSNSIDPDDGIGAWNWVGADGTADALTGADTERPTFVAPAVGDGGKSFVFVLTVTDAQGLRAVDRCTVHVVKENTPPVADAGPDRRALAGRRVVLSAVNSSDAEGAIASFTWRQLEGPPVTFSDPGVAAPTFEVPSPPEGESACALVFEVEVADSEGLKSRDTCIVNVSSQDVPPVANAGPDRVAAPGATVVLDGSASSDPDDGIAFAYWEQVDGPLVDLLDGGTLAPSFTAPAASVMPVSLAFRLVVTDARGLSSKDFCIVNVSSAGVNLVASAGEDRSVSGGTTVQLDGSGSVSSTGTSGTIPAARWRQIGGPPVTIANPAALVTTFAAPAGSASGTTLVFRLIVTDESGLRARDDCTITVVSVQ